MWTLYSYDKRGGPDAFKSWRHSIMIYPKVEPFLIRRIRWMWRNIDGFDKWQAFRSEFKREETADIPLFSYVRARDPKENNKPQYATRFLQELWQHRLVWKGKTNRKFAQVMMWDLRHEIKDRTLLKKVAEFYFAGNKFSTKYEDIQALLGRDTQKLQLIRQQVQSINAEFKPWDRFKTPKQEQLKLKQKLDKRLSSVNPDLLFEVIVSLENTEVLKRCFQYLWTRDIPGKKETLIKLFTQLEFSDHDIDETLFPGIFPNLIKNEDDPNLEIAKAFFAIPEKDFRNDYVWKKSKEATSIFFLTIAHQPTVFSYLLDLVQKETAENRLIIEAVLSNIFSAEYETKINPTLKFSKSQIESMLDRVSTYIQDNRSRNVNEALGVLFYTENPLALDWLRDKHNNKSWLKQFANPKIREEVNENIEEAIKTITTAGKQE